MNRTPYRWLRVLAPALIIVAWLAAMAIGGPYFGKIDEVSSNDPAAYLPAGVEATQVQERLSEFQGEAAVPAIVVFAGDDEVDGTDLAAAQSAIDGLAGISGVSGDASPVIPTADGTAAEAFIGIDQSANIPDTVDEVRHALAAEELNGMSVAVTGPAGFSADLSDAFAGIDGLLLLVALSAVLVILIVVYRSPLLPLLVLVTSVSALTAALLTVWWLAKLGIVALSGQTQGILFILVIGAATDYSLLYVARYRDALTRHASRWEATRAALRGSWEPILASAATVIAGLLCLLLSMLGSNRALGPIAAIGIVFSLLAALTLLPAILFAVGRAAFWPRKLPFTPRHTADEVTTTGVWARIPVFVRRHARIIWIVTTVVLLGASLALPTLKADGVATSELVLGSSEARDGQRTLSERGGTGTPASIIAPEGELEAVGELVLATPGVESLAVASADAPGGRAPVTENGIVGVIPGTTPAPTVSNGDVLLYASLTDAADSAAAEQTVVQLRETLGERALVGGPTAIAVDTNAASIRDRAVIIPIVLLVITIILALLMRAIVAALVLLATVVLSFTATLGVSALVFNEILGFPGADPAVPLFGFVFLVALGIDYNIFLMSRVREEALAHGAQAGISRGLTITGGVITSAGLVLAATFAALAVLPILFLAQLAFIVTFGVLLDTLIVRTLLVPALAHELGRAFWWPSKRIAA